MLGLCMLPQALQLSRDEDSDKKSVEQNWDQVMSETNFAFEYTTFPQFLVAHSISGSD